MSTDRNPSRVCSLVIAVTFVSDVEFGTLGWIRKSPA